MSEPASTEVHQKESDRVMAIYKLGSEACMLAMEKPDGWKRKLKANARAARKLGVNIHDNCFFDVALPMIKK